MTGVRSRHAGVARRNERSAPFFVGFVLALLLPSVCLAVDGSGKLCLNRGGGLPILLGSGIDLERKLATLTRLLAEHPSLQVGTDIAYVNLYAWDAPALMLRVSGPAPQPQQP